MTFCAGWRRAKAPGGLEVMAVATEVEARPLSGCRVLVTRAAEQAGELVSRIEALGGRAVLFPLIQIRPVSETGPLDAALDRLDEFDWIVFTSVNTVTLFLERMRRRNMAPDRLKPRVAAVGPKTRAALEAEGVAVELVPAEYHAEGLLEALLPHMSPGTRVLFPRSAIARRILPEELGRRGVLVTAVDVYETVPVRQGGSRLAALLAEKAVDIVTFTSSSTVQSFVDLLSAYDRTRLLQGVAVASIGPQTSATCRQLGLTVAVEARPSDLDGLVRAIVQWRQSKEGENADV